MKTIEEVVSFLHYDFCALISIFYGLYLKRNYYKTTEFLQKVHHVKSLVYY